MDDNKITPELKFLTKDDILALCDEAQKPTVMGKLAAISLDNIVSILDEKATSFYNEAIYYSKERKRWFIYKIAAAIICLIFLPRIHISHILFWANLGFLAIGFICENYTKKLFFYYKNKHSKIFEILAMVNKALGIEDTKEA